MSVREAIVLPKFERRVSVDAVIVRPAPGVRRRPRLVNGQRPATAPMPVRYSQSVAAGCAAPQEEFRGYRMSRAARLSVTLSVVVTGLILLFTSVLSTGAPALQQVTVSSGDTIWSIAESVAPGSDADYIVGQIIDVNELSGPDLALGLVLQVPTGN